MRSTCLLYDSVTHALTRCLLYIAQMRPHWVKNCPCDVSWHSLFPNTCSTHSEPLPRITPDPNMTDPTSQKLWKCCAEGPLLSFHKEFHAYFKLFYKNAYGGQGRPPTPHTSAQILNLFWNGCQTLMNWHSSLIRRKVFVICSYDFQIAGIPMECQLHVFFDRIWQGIFSTTNLAIHDRKPHGEFLP